MEGPRTETNPQLPAPPRTHPKPSQTHRIWKQTPINQLTQTRQPTDPSSARRNSDARASETHRPPVTGRRAVFVSGTGHDGGVRHHDEAYFALEEARLNIVHPAPVPGLDMWRVHMLTAGDFVDRHDWTMAERMHHMAWRDVGDDRARQGSTMQLIGQRLWQYGDRDSAAAFFEVARALRHGFAAPDLLASTRAALADVRAASHYDAIVLSGGRGTRIGGGKPERQLASWPLLDHVLVAVSSASHRIVVGPIRRGLGEPIFVSEDPPGSGPVAGIAAALASVEQDLVAVFAADIPFIRPEIDQFRAILAVSPEKDAMVMVDTAGRINYLAAMWRTDSLRRAVAELGNPAGLPMRALYENANTANAPDYDAVGSDVDTPNDLAIAEERIWQLPPWVIKGTRPEWLPATPLAWPGLALRAPS
jgi:molybdopterin-guanine dinucleotide biosynthesis protein A